MKRADFWGSPLSVRPSSLSYRRCQAAFLLSFLALAACATGDDLADPTGWAGSGGESGHAGSSGAAGHGGTAGHAGSGGISPEAGPDANNAGSAGSAGAAGSTPRCGNSVIESGEACDDGNLTVSDGCSPLCTVESGFHCSGEPSVCSPDCGNGTCDTGETPATCSQDCPVRCGDGICSAPSESSHSCAEDCPASCGDGICSAPAENPATCAQDCPVSCGDGVCSKPTENVANCPADCSISCGDGECSRPTENISNCAQDCPAYCGDQICTRPAENASNCSQDCPVQCGDGVCSRPSENASNCSQDCPVLCGDSVCSSPSENVNNCAQDCPVRCGDGVCSRPTENISNCAQDCPALCGDSICSPSENSSTCSQDCSPVCQVDGDISNLLGGASKTGSNATGHNSVDLACLSGTGPEAIYSITPSFSGDMVVSVVNPGTAFDTGLGVWASPCGSGATLTCNDDYNGNTASQVTLPVTAGSPYYVTVEGFQGATGNFELTVHQAGVCEGVGGPTGDITSNIDTGTVGFDTTSAVASLTGACGGRGREALLRFTAPHDGQIHVSTIFSSVSYDTVLYARHGDCDSMSAEVACSDDAAGAQSWLDFNVQSGQTYQIFADAFGAGQGGPTELAVGYNLFQSTVTDAVHACASQSQDVYGVSVMPGEQLTISADTIAAASAADLCVFVFDTDGTTQVVQFDDEMACTYPPPSYRCPQGTTPQLTHEGIVYLHVAACSGACVNQTNVGYRLNVESTVSGAVTLMRVLDQ